MIASLILFSLRYRSPRSRAFSFFTSGLCEHAADPSNVTTARSTATERRRGPFRADRHSRKGDGPGLIIGNDPACLGSRCHCPASLTRPLRPLRGAAVTHHAPKLAG